MATAAPTPVANPPSLDTLYAHLQAATSRAEAAPIENQIVAEAGRAVSPSAGILLDQAHAEEADRSQAIDIDPRDFLSWISLSVALEHAGNTDGAIAAWKRVLAIDPHAENSQSRLQMLTRKAEGEHA